MKSVFTKAGITYLISLAMTSASFAQVVPVIPMDNSPFGQVSATANTSVSIVTQLSISRIVDMNFGEMKGTAIAGTVILTPAEQRIAKGGVLLVPGTAETAMFTIGGQGSYTYSVTLPPSAHAVANGVNNITVSDFKSLPTNTGNLSDVLTLNVGATLNVAGNQAAGNYTSASPFNVVVNYN